MHGITTGRKVHISARVTAVQHRGSLGPVTFTVRTGDADFQSYLSVDETRELGASLLRIADDAEKAGETIEQAATRLGS
jgi:hypothetical protein